MSEQRDASAYRERARKVCPCWGDPTTGPEACGEYATCELHHHIALALDEVSREAREQGRRDSVAAMQDEAAKILRSERDALAGQLAAVRERAQAYIAAWNGEMEGAVHVVDGDDCDAALVALGEAVADSRAAAEAHDARVKREALREAAQCAELFFDESQEPADISARACGVMIGDAIRALAEKGGSDAGLLARTAPKETRDGGR